MTYWPTDVDSGGQIKASAKVRVAALFPSRIFNISDQHIRASSFLIFPHLLDWMWMFGGISCNLNFHVGSLCCFDGGVTPRWFALILLWTVDFHYITSPSFIVPKIWWRTVCSCNFSGNLERSCVSHAKAWDLFRQGPMLPVRFFRIRLLSR